MTQDEFSAELVERCRIAARPPHGIFTTEVIAVLRASGYAKLAAALERCEALHAKQFAEYIERAANDERHRNAELVAALGTFVALADKRDARYRKRGGNPDAYPDTHPSYDIDADKRELPMGAWRKARAALAAAGHKQGSGE